MVEAPPELFDILSKRVNLSKGFSEYWRKNKSSLEAAELAYALRALRKVGRYIATNFKVIEWAGMSESDRGKILLDASLALGEYPIPPGRMDVLVGLVAHEAYHCRELSDLVWVKVESSYKELHPAHKAYLCRLVDIGEDIYVNHASRGSVWKNYIDKAWGWCRPKEIRELTLPPTPKCLFQIWEEFVLEGQRPEFIHPDYFEPLNILLFSVDDIVNSGNKNSLLDKSTYRSKLYLALWETISRFIDEWEAEDAFEPDGVNIPDERGHKVEDDLAEERKNSEDQDDLNKGKKALSGDLGSRIKSVLEESEAKDITEEVEAVCGEITSEVMRTVFWDATLPCRANADPELVRRLRRTFQIQKTRKSQNYRANRGLLYGKVDGRRLYRAHIDGRAFKQKEPLYLDNSWNIAILVDASASMKGGGGGGGGKEWAIAENTFTSLYQAAKGSGNRLDVLCYFERAGQCEVVRLLHNNKLFTIIPNGRTPTGQGIIAAGLNLRKDKKRFIIHVTDGEPNCGVSVDHALEFCKREDIDLVTIGCCYNDEIREQFQEQYKDSLYLMDSIDQLPEGMELLIRRKLLKGKAFKDVI